ncbi:hypothetical protein Tco_0962184 [Tanacetum coccineum]
MRRCFIPNQPEKLLPEQVEKDQQLLLEVLQRLLALSAGPLDIRASPSALRQHVSRWHVSDLVFGVKVVSILQVLVVDQMFVPFVHPTSVVSVLTPIETMLYLLCRHCYLPPERTAGPYLLRRLRLLALTLPPEETTALTLPPEETCCSSSLEETDCSLPLEETGCSLPFEETCYFLPPEETGSSLCYLLRRLLAHTLPPEKTAGPLLTS